MKEEPNTTKNLSIGGMKTQQCRVGSELDVGMELKLRKSTVYNELRYNSSTDRASTGNSDKEDTDDITEEGRDNLNKDSTDDSNKRAQATCTKRAQTTQIERSQMTLTKKTWG